MLFTLIFLDSFRPDEVIDMPRPQVGAVLKVPNEADGELEYWIVDDVLPSALTVRLM